MAAKRRRRSRQASIEFRPSGRGGARPGAGRPRTRRSRVAHRPRGAVPGHCPVMVTLRVLDDVPGLRRARVHPRVPQDTPQGRGAARVPGGALLDPGRPRALLRGSTRQGVPRERDEEPGRTFRALREPGVRACGAGVGGPLPPRGEAYADGSAAGAGVCAAERAQALLAAASAGAAGGAGWREFRGCGSTAGRAGRRRRGGMRTRLARAKWRRPGRGC